MTKNRVLIFDELGEIHTFLDCRIQKELYD